MTQQPLPEPSNHPASSVDGRCADTSPGGGGESCDPNRPDDGGLDRHVERERPWQGTDHGDPSLTVRVQVRIVTGRSADAVRTAQGHALRALITTLTDRNAEPT